MDERLKNFTNDELRQICLYYGEWAASGDKDALASFRLFKSELDRR
jgi:hypothetical protein